MRRPELVVHNLKELTLELADKLTELIELKVDIAAEEADNTEEELVVVVELQHLHYLLLDLTISVAHELETLICCCGITKEDYRTRLDCYIT